MSDTRNREPIKARLDSRCPGCLSLIYVGDPIYLVENRWLCKPCFYAARRSGVLDD